MVMMNKEQIIDEVYENYSKEYEKCGNLKISLEMLEILDDNNSSEEIR